MTVTSLVERKNLISRSAQRPLHRDPQRPIEERLDSLLAAMTRAEKIAQLSIVGVDELITADQLDGEKLAARLADGAAAITGISAVTDIDPAGYARLCGQLQDYLCDQTRLGVPALICEDGGTEGSIFHQVQIPPPIAAAASFDPALQRAVADCLRKSLRALGITQLLGPTLDIVDQTRRPKLTRSFGADPYLVGQMGVAFLRGMGGERDRQGVLATARSFLGAPAASGEAQARVVHLGRRALRETLAEPFAAAVREAGLSAVVVADSAIDGIACTGAPEVLNDLLRNELGFRGLVISEERGVRHLVEHHRVAADELAASVLALSAGVDVELSGGCFSASLDQAIEQRQITAEQLDTAVRRVLHQKLKLGLLDDVEKVDLQKDELHPDDRKHRQSDNAESGAPRVVTSSADGGDSAGADEEQLRRLAGRMAQESVVLLRNNDNVLPLAGDLRLGLAGDVDSGFADALADAGVNASVISRSGEGAGGPDPALLAGFEHVLMTMDFIQPGAAARRNPGRDAEPQLLTAQLQQLRQLVALNVPVTVVLAGTCVWAVGLLPPEVAGVLINWCPGGSGQHALAGILTGAVNPSGRLPVALPDSPDGPGKQPLLYGFGHGLSYSHFEYHELQSVDTVDTHGAVEVSVVVVNESEVAGCEVVQLYLQDPVADVVRPLRQLAGFHRLMLAPGQSKRIVFGLDVSQFAYYNRQLEYVVDPGRIELMVGPSSTDIRSRRRLTVQGDRRLFKQQQRLATQSHDQDISP